MEKFDFKKSLGQNMAFHRHNDVIINYSKFYYYLQIKRQNHLNMIKLIW